MKALICSLLLALTSLAVTAQNAKDVHGLWKYNRMADAEDMDPKMLPLMERMMGSITVSINKNGRYHAAMMGKDEYGSWAFTKDGNSLELWADKGTIGWLEMIPDNANELAMVAGKGSIIIARVGGEKPAKVTDAPAVEAQAATEKQLQGQGFYNGRVNEEGVADAPLKERASRVNWKFL